MDRGNISKLQRVIVYWKVSRTTRRVSTKEQQAGLLKNTKTTQYSVSPSSTKLLRVLRRIRSTLPQRRNNKEKGKKNVISSMLLSFIASPRSVSSLQSPLSSSQIHSKKLRFLLQPQLSSLPLQNPSPNKPCLTTRTSSAGNPDRKTRT